MIMHWFVQLLPWSSILLGTEARIDATPLKCPDMASPILDISSSIVENDMDFPVVLDTALPAGVTLCLFARFTTVAPEISTMASWDSQNSMKNNDLRRKSRISSNNFRSIGSDKELTGAFARLLPGKNWAVSSLEFQLSIRDSSIVPDDYKYDFFDCTSVSSCSLEKFPFMYSSNPGKDSFALISFNHTLGDVADTDPSAALLATQRHASRFLDRTTFGATLESIDELLSVPPSEVTAEDDLYSKYAAWVSKQMDAEQTPLSSHRAYYRKRADRRLLKLKRRGHRWTNHHLPSQPCDPGSRWQTYTFNLHDQHAGNVQIKYNYEADPKHFIEMWVGSKLITTMANITYDKWGEGITMVPEGSYLPRLYYPNYDDGNDPLVKRNTTANIQGTGILYLFIGTGPAMIHGGNPPIVIPEAYFNNDTHVTPHNVDVIHIPLAGVHDLTTVPYNLFQGTLYQYDETNSDPGCKNLPYPEQRARVLGILQDGTQAMFYPHTTILDNTPENPIPGGGFDNMIAGAKCSNVKRSFMNEDTCYVSDDPKTCGRGVTNANMVLNEQSVLALNKASGGRYAYIIEGLRFEDDYSDHHPCEGSSRWKYRPDLNETACQAMTPDIGAATKQSLALLVNYHWCHKNCGRWNYERNTGNLKYRHITMTSTYNKDCDAKDPHAIGVFVYYWGKCFQHVHPNEGDIRDMTYWTEEHPGNSESRNPIKEFIDDLGTTIFKYPWHHSMGRWYQEEKHFPKISYDGMKISFNSLPDVFRIRPVAEAFGTVTGGSGKGVVVCGSENEVARDPEMANTIFEYSYDFPARWSPTGGMLTDQKISVWRMINLKSPDQLRQRMAWALSQIFPVNEAATGSTYDERNEGYLKYYDIFVRHAFGNYRDVLKEISFSPMMAKMLTFLNSASSLYTRKRSPETIFPDENFAREVMQLFTVGLMEKNMDGTERLDYETGLEIPTYTNDHIMSYSRAWTGFESSPSRGNYEPGWVGGNIVDPLSLSASKRDIFPKISVIDGAYVGDGLPLCHELPQKHFLQAGAKYRILGSLSTPEYVYEKSHWISLGGTTRMILNQTHSELFNELNNFIGLNGTNFFLTQDVVCHGAECQIDALRQVNVNGTYFEYIRPPCVNFPFFDESRVIKKRHPFYWVCENELNSDVASTACTLDQWPLGRARDFCKYSGELVSYKTGVERCNTTGFLWYNWYTLQVRPKGCIHDHYWHWHPNKCSILAKVQGTSGNIAIVHLPADAEAEKVPTWNEVNEDNVNYFSVHWHKGTFPSPADQCGNGACSLTSDKKDCMCDVQVEESRVFSDYPKDVESVLSSLSIGSFFPDKLKHLSFDKEHNLVYVYHDDNGSPFDSNTVFGVEFYGEMKYFKNVESSVFLINKPESAFRNPPMFYSLKDAEYGINARDVFYETEAVLDSYMYHENTAPFISHKLLQRFGVSNPSPNQILSVSTAFRVGKFVSMDGQIFGKDRYGDLAATIAAILLDPEFLNISVDADPTSGAMKEPILKVMSFLRATKFEGNEYTPETRLFLHGIGQEAHHYPSIFSFFESDYAAPGPLTAAGVSSPETMVMTAPTTIALLNGLFSYIDIGMANCFGGFGGGIWFAKGDHRGGECPRSKTSWSRETLNKVTYGMAQYTPKDTYNAEDLVEELSILHTNGRLSGESKKIIVEAVYKVPNPEEGLRLAQKLIVTTPEFHSTNIIARSGKLRPELKPPKDATKAYKAVVYVMLKGGADSNHILIPHSECVDERDWYAEYAKARGNATLPKKDLLIIDPVSNQLCKKFGINNKLPNVHQMYLEKDLAFFAGVGILAEPSDRTNWVKNHKGRAFLFSHNSGTKDNYEIDLFKRYAGTGIGGRMNDLLTAIGLRTVSISVSGASKMLAGDQPVVIINPSSGILSFNPSPFQSEEVDLKQVAYNLNNGTTVTSGLFGETWSRLLYQSIGQNEILISHLASVPVPSGLSTGIGKQLRTVAHLIKARDVRKIDRDIFFIDWYGHQWDTHFGVPGSLLTQLDDAVKWFRDEMKEQEIWDDVVLVEASEMGRTMTTNTAGGADHGWAGHYFIAGGKVKGGLIWGKFPDFTEASSLNIGRGRIVPTTSWESIWNPIAEFVGLRQPAQLDKLLPNRHKFPDNKLYKYWQVFDFPRPTRAPIKKPCRNVDLRGMVYVWRKNFLGAKRNKVFRHCPWLKRQPQKKRRVFCNQFSRNKYKGKRFRVKQWCRRTCRFFCKK